MKFTQQQLSEKLREKITNNGKKTLQQSKRSFDALVEKIYKRLEKAGDDSEIDSIVEEYAPDFETIEGNLRSDYASFVSKWNTEHPSSETKPSSSENKPDSDDADSTVKKLMERLEKMEQKQAQIEKEKKISTMRSSLAGEMKKKGISSIKWIDSYVAKIALDEDSDIEAETEDALKLYNELKAGGEDDTQPGKPGAKNGNDFDISDLKRNKN